jgi:uncharacterized protein (UPF0261 family)
MPLRGVSALDLPDEPFYYPETNRGYFDALKANLDRRIRLIEVNANQR